MKPWLCKIGLHDWAEPERQRFGDRRKCRRCTRIQELVEDGIWNTGDWMTVRDEKGEE